MEEREGKVEKREGKGRWKRERGRKGGIEKKRESHLNSYHS